MPLFQTQKKIYLSHTDATGVLFFPMQLLITSHILEEFLHAKGAPLASILKNKEFLMPVRHLESDYLTPLHVGDIVDCHIANIEFGTSSLTIFYELYLRQKLAGRVKVVHVAIDPVTLEKIPLPKVLINSMQFGN